MAITITATPASLSSLHDNLIYTVSSSKTSDPTTYPNYKFIGDVYVTISGTPTLVARIKKIPHPDTGIGIFNVGQVVRNYVTTVFNPAPNVLKAQELGTEEFFLTVTLKFGESYSTTTTLNVTTDSARVFYNNYNGRLVGSDSSLTGLSNKVASTRSVNTDVSLTSAYHFVPYFPSSTSAITVTVTAVGGGSGFSSTVTPSAANNMQIINVAPVALNAVHSGTINASTQYYTVLIGSQTYRFDVICEPVYTVHTLHFLNKYGGWESKLFNKVSRRTVEITRKDFGKIDYSVDGSGVVSYHNSNGVYNETRSVYAVQFGEVMTLNSDILSDDEYAWLEQLVLSPMVYLQDGSYFFPCIIKASNYEPKKIINDDLTNLTLTIEFGNQLQAQSR
jgi:hypothetical protein